MPRKAAAKKPTGKTNVTETKPRVIKPKPVEDVSTLIRMGALKCRNKVQKDLLNLINRKDIVIAAGPAGVGKSYVTIARALELLKDGNSPYTRIVISKPAVEAEEEHGFLPGDAREKMEPFIASTLNILDELIGQQNRLKLEEFKFLIIEPLAYLRGKTLKNCIVVMEEAQNMSPNQMKTLLTRIGENSKYIISGDLDQSDRYKRVQDSGLYDALQKHRNIEEIGFIEFGDEDIVRHPIISKILANYKVAPKVTVPQLLVEEKIFDAEMKAVKINNTPDPLLINFQGIDISEDEEPKKKGFWRNII